MAAVRDASSELAASAAQQQPREVLRARLQALLQQAPAELGLGSLARSLKETNLLADSQRELARALLMCWCSQEDLPNHPTGMAFHTWLGSINVVHILPPKLHEDWWTAGWSKDAHATWVNRLGNGCLLGGTLPQRMGNSGYANRRQVVLGQQDGANAVEDGCNRRLFEQE